MFRDVYGRLVNFFVGLYLAAFDEAARRADAEISRRLDAASIPSGRPPFLPPSGVQPAALADLTQPVTPPAEKAKPVAFLPPLPPLPEVNGGVTQVAKDGLPPRRPRGRPRKEPPPC